MTLTHDRRTELLAGCPLFSGVAPPDLAAVAGRAIEVDFPANHVIARQGEIGTGFFLIVTGSVKVVRGGDEVAVLGPGDFFGASEDKRVCGTQLRDAISFLQRCVEPLLYRVHYAIHRHLR